MNNISLTLVQVTEKDEWLDEDDEDIFWVHHYEGLFEGNTLIHFELLLPENMREDMFDSDDAITTISTRTHFIFRIRERKAYLTNPRFGVGVKVSLKAPLVVVKIDKDIGIPWEDKQSSCEIFLDLKYA